MAECYVEDCEDQGTEPYEILDQDGDLVSIMVCETHLDILPPSTGTIEDDGSLNISVYTGDQDLPE